MNEVLERKWLRSVRIDWPALFKEAGIHPCRCKLAFSLVAGSWALMREDEGGIEIFCITPPALESGEVEIRIRGSHWEFFG